MDANVENKTLARLLG